jgi:demethylmenaquinone methyltransferase/2-methoxy-6-polyprenyl-1,4-benzoquinol methylase
MFGAIAEKYDVMNSIMSLGLDRHWRRQAVQTARIRPGDRVADICCGTGQLTLAARAAAGRSGEVVGLDFSADMLRVAAANIEAAGRRAQRDPEAGTDNIRFVRGDARELPFATADFDAVLVGWGLRNVPDRERVVREMRRIVKPGGRVVSLDMGQPRLPGLSAVYWPLFSLAVPFLGQWCAGKKAREYRYLYESAREFLPQWELADLFRRCGLVGTGALDLVGGAVAVVYGEKSPRYPGD